MCVSLKWQKVKSVSDYSVHSVLVPCGECSECQQAKKSEWLFRIDAERSVLSALGWKMGFFTLTYKESRLPYIDAVLKETGENFALPCFSKLDVQRLMSKLRVKLWKIWKRDFQRNKDEKFPKPRFMVCSELGGRTFRPHYHGIIFFAPCFSEKLVHTLLKSYWRRNGFIIPWKSEGGFDRKKRFHKPFLVSNSGSKASWYASKYCCKDLAFTTILKDYIVDDKSWNFKNGRCFHLQSRGLGSAWLIGKKDDEKMKALCFGECFDGRSSYSPLPVYLRNKIIFDYNYIVVRSKDGSVLRRLVRRKANAFFRAHYKEIYLECVDNTRNRLENLFNRSFWQSRGFSECYIESCFKEFRKNTLVRFDWLAQLLVAYHNVKTVWTSDCAKQWFSRYCPDVLDFPNVYGLGSDFSLSTDDVKALNAYEVFLSRFVRYNSDIDVDFIIEDSTVKHTLEEY